MRLALLITDQCVPTAVFGLADIFAVAAYSAKQRARIDSPQIEVRIVTVTSAPVQSFSGVEIKPTADMDYIQQADVVLVVPFVLTKTNYQAILDSTQSVLPALQKAWQQGCCIASTSTGSFIVAEAGLLDQRGCTTHWRVAKLFQRRYPLAKLDSRKNLVEDDNLITTGGATSFLFLAMRLIEKFYDRELMMDVAKIVVLDPTQDQQTPLKLLIPEQAHRDDKIKAVQTWLEGHFADSITVEQLAKQHGMSVRTLSRRFKQATQSSPLAYLQQVRIEAAKTQLATQVKSTSDIIWDVGYEDVSSFRRLFKKRTGMTMESYRNSFSHSYRASAVG